MVTATKKNRDRQRPVLQKDPFFKTCSLKLNFSTDAMVNIVTKVL